MEGEAEGCRRVNAGVALRFPDPLNRKDAAGRIIPHDFLVTRPLADDIRSVEDGVRKVWPLVADLYAQVWSGKYPLAGAVQSAFDTGSPVHP